MRANALSPPQSLQRVCRTDFSLSSGLTSLQTLSLSFNQLTNLTLPSDVTRLESLYLDGNPMKTLVLPEPLALEGLAGEVASLRGQGVSVYTYPVAVNLVSAKLSLAGAFAFTLIGPPGRYTVLGSTNLAAWRELGTLTNNLGSTAFTDSEAKNSVQHFYRALTSP